MSQLREFNLQASLRLVFDFDTLQIVFFTTFLLLLSLSPSMSLSPIFHSCLCDIPLQHQVQWECESKIYVRTEKWIKLWYILNGIHSDKKKTWNHAVYCNFNGTEDYNVSQSQREEEKFQMISLICGIKRNKSRVSNDDKQGYGLQNW